ncbi:hypothetical protein PTKIN_Ptkin17bG0113900 [Pterospermum kingtungense]
MIHATVPLLADCKINLIQVSHSTPVWRFDIIIYGKQEQGKAQSLVFHISFSRLNLNSAVWSSPSPGFVKVNFDGALQLLDHIEGVGIVIRNHEAKVLGAKSLRVHVASDSFVIKAIAAMFALEFAVDLGFTDIILEGDALSIVKGINDVGEDLSPIGVILQEAKQRKTSFRQCQVVHVARSANNVAHMLAKFGLTCDVERIWIEESPECIQSVIQTRLPISS